MARGRGTGTGSRTFRDRDAAGQELARALLEQGIRADVVLAIPRGGLPIGRAIAEHLGIPLDVIVAKKIGAPGNPELAIGAATADGDAWLNGDIIEHLGIAQDHVESAREKAARQALEKAQRYRPAGPGIELEGKRVIVADDGVATGATTRACLRSAKAKGAAAVILAVPVGPPENIEELRAHADAVICLETPLSFVAVGQFYDRFEPVTDDEAVEILEGTT